MPRRLSRRTCSTLFVALACLLLPGSPGAFGASPDPRSAPTLRAVLAKIAKSYVDRSRIDPQRMLWSAAAALDREIPEVLLESNAGAAEVRIRVAGESRTFRADDVRSIARLSDTLSEILQFVGAHRAPSEDRSSAEYAAVNGILDSLDPHSLLFTPAEARMFDNQVDNTLTGVGMVMNFNVRPVTITAVMKGGPALAAGVAPCDRLLAVEGVSTEGRSFEDVIPTILGPVGTAVWLTFDRDGSGLRELILTRQKIVLSSVTSRLLDDGSGSVSGSDGGIGYILIQQFSRRTASDVEAAIADLKKAGARGWILDLRGNPGGLMKEAVGTASLFIESGPIVATVSEDERDSRDAKREHPIPAEGGPLAVLVSERTASASEVLAGALQNRNRAVVLGRTSFGKGTVQVLYGQKDGSKLKLSIAHYVTPGGFSLQSRGVVPDIELVPVPAPKPGRLRLSEIEPPREADLERAFRPRVPAVRPDFSMRYVASLPNGEEEIGIARDLLLELPASVGTRKVALEHARAFVDGRRAPADERIVRVLGEAGVDWSEGPAGDPAGAVADNLAEPGGKPAKPGVKPAKILVRCTQTKSVVLPAPPEAQLPEGAGQRVPIDCEVRNEGERDAFRLRGRAPARSFDLGGDEIVIGRMAAGERRRVSFEGLLDANPAARVSYVPFEFSEQGGAQVDIAPVRIEAPARTGAARTDRTTGLDIRVDAPAETGAIAAPLRVAIVDKGEPRDAWIRVSAREPRIDRKKVLYAARDAGSPDHRMDLAADVPLSPGLNEIEVCARDRDATGQRCDTVFVFRTASGF